MTLLGKTFGIPSLVLIGGSLTAVVLILSLTIRSGGIDRWVAKQHVHTLIAEISREGKDTSAEFNIWKGIAASDALIRLEMARSLQDKKYAQLLIGSTELISKSIIGADHDGEMSKALSEQLICKGLESNPEAHSEEVSLYLVPWLNPAKLGSEYCAQILTDNFLTANSETLLQRAKLLEHVLGQMPSAQVEPYVAHILGMMETADSANMDVLFSVLQKLDSTIFDNEFQAATQTLLSRIAEAQSSSDIAILFESINYLKHEVTAEQLALVLDVVLSKVLTLNDGTLTHSVYFTLLDLKISHPGISFGRRADYLMRGINIYGDNVEIFDYTGVLHLDEQYSSSPGDTGEKFRCALDFIQNGFLRE